LSPSCRYIVRNASRIPRYSTDLCAADRTRLPCAYPPRPGTGLTKAAGGAVSDCGAKTHDVRAAGRGCAEARHGRVGMGWGTCSLVLSRSNGLHIRAAVMPCTAPPAGLIHITLDGERRTSLWAHTEAAPAKKRLCIGAGVFLSGWMLSITCRTAHHAPTRALRVRSKGKSRVMSREVRVGRCGRMPRQLQRSDRPS
jgi:hypothetical protein